MNIKDGLKLKGRPAEIPDCSRDDLPQFFVDMGYKVGVEIGVDKGEYTEILAKSGLQIHGIDSWKIYKDYGDLDYQVKLDSLYEQAKRTLAPYSNCAIIRKTSMEAVGDFEDESLDFVYIDGNHHFKYVAEDVYEWSRKVRKGGVISGHDYMYGSASCMGACHVIYVLNAYTQAYDVKNWYVLGRKATLEGEKRDRWRSWMWIKS